MSVADDHMEQCTICEGPNYHPMTGTCPDHIDYVECPDCESLIPMVEGVYVEGTPDVYYLRNGDPGYPGDPPELYCPACPTFIPNPDWHSSHSVELLHWLEPDEDGGEQTCSAQACIECGIRQTQRGMAVLCHPEPPEPEQEPPYPDDSLEGHCLCHDAAICPDG